MIILLFEISFTAYVIYWLIAPEEIFGFYGQWLLSFPEKIKWLSKPLGGCYRCFTGQICMWSYLVIYRKEYNLIEHGFFIAGGIFLSMVYNLIFAILTKLNDRYDT
jgi:hypothetical protein